MEVAHSDLDDSPLASSVRGRAGGDELLIRSAEWVGHEGEVEARVLAWLLRHIDLRGATTAWVAGGRGVKCGQERCAGRTRGAADEPLQDFEPR